MYSLYFAVTLWLNLFFITYANVNEKTETGISVKPQKDPAEKWSPTRSKSALSANETRTTDHGIRRAGVLGENHEWGWEKWCQLQPKLGTCAEPQKRYYYDAQVDSCREFTYTGCNGNQNRFPTKNDCERFCKGFGTVLETKTIKQAEGCSLQPNPGNCLAFLLRYYFDINAGECKEFVFGGCGGNANRFLDRMACKERCEKHFKRL